MHMVPRPKLVCINPWYMTWVDATGRTIRVKRPEAKQVSETI